MPWQTITILIPDEAVKEAVVGEFSVDHIAGVWERPHPGGALEIVLYFESGSIPPLVEARITRIFERNDLPVPVISRGEEENIDWTVEWRKGFSSFGLGTRFRVVPGWEEPPAGDERIALRIDPGMAFGTGTHESTRMVVERVETLDVSVPILDLGTGSGILTIAARKLGADLVVGCDIDSDAVAVARANLRRNDVVAGLFVGTIDAVRDGWAGLVLANLTADVIEASLDEIVRVLSPSGRAVLAGVLTSQAEALETSLRSVGLVPLDSAQCGEWTSVLVAHGR